MSKVFLDIVIGNKAIGRIEIELFFDVTPKTAENFRGLCTGEYGLGKVYKKKLHYLGSRFHKIVEEQYIQAGDYIYGNGSAGESIYGKIFNDENFQRRHACAGLISMANKGRNSNSSQFFITLKPCPQFDGKNVVFGQVIDGMDVVRQIGKVPCDVNERPITKIIIFNCGDYDVRRIHIIEDPFKQAMNALHQDRLEKEKVKQMGPDEADEYKKQKMKSAFNKIQDYDDENDEENQVYEMENDDYGEEEENEEDFEEGVISKLGSETYKKLLELRSKINEAKNLNTQAVKEENIRTQDPNYEKNKLKEEFRQKKEEIRETLRLQGVPEDKLYTLDTINKCEIVHNKEMKKHKNSAFGWDVFNTDALYRAYRKRLKNMPFDKELYEDQIKNPNISLKVTEERKSLLNNDLEEQMLKRKTYSRRRAFYDDKDVDYINDRNRKFNEKLNRFFEKDAAEIKANLERGTAL